MKKILLINTKYREFGGEDSNIDEELKFLKKFYIVEYLEFKNSEKIKLSDIYSFLFQTNFVSNKILKDKLNSFNPDVVYIHNTWFKAGLGIFKILNTFDCQVVLKIHNFRYYCTQSFIAKKHLNNKKFCFKCGFSGSFFNKYYKESVLKSIAIILYSKKYLKILQKKNIKILTLNKFHKKNLMNLNVPDSNIHIFYNPLNLSFLKSDYNPESKYLVYAGRISESKGVNHLLDSWNSAQLNKLELRIIGDGNIKKNLEDKYQFKNIRFMGQLSNTEVLEQIKNSKAVITATKMEEGQPRILNEASILGVPSIFPDFGGMSEYFPKNYFLSFEQYNYQDLIMKLQKLTEKDELLNISNEILAYSNKILDYDVLIEEFEKILK